MNIMNTQQQPFNFNNLPRLQIPEIKNTRSKHFKEGWKIYESSFPPDERRDLETQTVILRKKEYAFRAVYALNWHTGPFLSTTDRLLGNIEKRIDATKPAGVFATWNFSDFVFIEHLAVKKECEDEGVGSTILGTLTQNALYNNKWKKIDKKVILEVERPDTETAQKRRAFYERQGFRLNKYDYIQPPYGKDKKSVPMYLMSFPEKIGKKEFLHMQKKLYKSVYGLRT